MYYSKIGIAGAGLSNQIFSLITSIIIAYRNNEKVVIIDNFLNDFSKKNYTPISQIININEINIFLKKYYDIIIVDKYNTKLVINSIKYGTKDNNIDLTEHYMHSFKNSILRINKDTNFNNIKGDPCFGIVKNIYLNYTINDYEIEEIYNEYLKNDISIDILNSEYLHTLNWVNPLYRNMFENILPIIQYNNDFIDKSCHILKEIDMNNKINIIHLRLENDGIQHWSGMNGMSEIDFKNYIDNKYIKLIEKYISKTDQNIIVSQSLDNTVINYLIQNNYNFKFNNKYFEDREKNAIVDLLTARHCNNVYIGNFNIEQLNGSTFSYYIGKIVNKDVKKIYIDLDRIHNNEQIYV